MILSTSHALPQLVFDNPTGNITPNLEMRTLKLTEDKLAKDKVTKQQNQHGTNSKDNNHFIILHYSIALSPRTVSLSRLFYLINSFIKPQLRHFLLSKKYYCSTTLPPPPEKQTHTHTHTHTHTLLGIQLTQTHTT